MSQVLLMIIVLAGWLIGAVVCYLIISKKFTHAWYEKVAFSVMWPLTLLLYFIHWLHMKL